MTESPGSPSPIDPALQAKIDRVLKDKIALEEHDPSWQKAFEEEVAHLRSVLPKGLAGRIEHFGSTAVKGLVAKPVVDMLVEVVSLERVREEVAPQLESLGYDYFWRPTFGDDGPPFYAWFIKRDAAGVRTHHIHMVPRHFEQHWRRLHFRDYLRNHPDVAEEYGALKRKLADAHSGDRVAYTQAKSEFITRVTEKAVREHQRNKASARTSDVRKSKFLALVLRHAPDRIGIELDSAGWVDVDVLLEALHQHGKGWSREDLDRVVAEDEKRRYSFSGDGHRIRANQGHSLSVDLALEAAVPPEFLFHGTVSRVLESIRQQGLIKGNRHHVHFSSAVETAESVGARRGEPVVLRVLARQMHDQGLSFYLSDNGVWLVDHVPAAFLEFPSGS